MVATDTNIMIEVFRTNVESTTDAIRVRQVLQQQFPESKITFDLQDCDKVLRLEGVNLVATKIQTILRCLGFHCLPLP